MVDIDDLARNLVSLDVTELKKLTDVLKDKYGLTAAVPVAAPTAIVEEAEKVEEQTEFNVTLKSVSVVIAEKMNTIRLIKEVTGLDLKAAKELSDHAPSLILEKTTKANAEMLQAKFKELNAEIEIK